MFTLHGDYLTQVMEAGATGCRLKDIKREDLTRAIRIIQNGQTLICESIRQET